MAARLSQTGWEDFKWSNPIYSLRDKIIKNDDSVALSYFMVTDDYKGYRLLYEVDDNEFTRYMPEIERMINSFKIAE
jgi:hypothetical protein